MIGRGGRHSRFDLADRLTERNVTVRGELTAEEVTTEGDTLLNTSNSGMVVAGLADASAVRVFTNTASSDTSTFKFWVNGHAHFDGDITTDHLYAADYLWSLKMFVNCNTATGSEKFRVNGDALFNGTATVDNITCGNSALSSAKLVTPAIYSLSTGDLTLFNVYNNSGSIVFKTTTSSTGTERARITNAGSLCVGATSPPASEKLYVNGDVTVKGALQLQKSDDAAVTANIYTIGSNDDAQLILDPEPLATAGVGAADTQPSGGTVVVRGALQVDGAAGQHQIHNQLDHSATIGNLKIESYHHSTLGKYMVLRNSGLNGPWGNEAAVIQRDEGSTIIGCKASTVAGNGIIEFRQGGTERAKLETDGKWKFDSDVTVTGELKVANLTVAQDSSATTLTAMTGAVSNVMSHGRYALAFSTVGSTVLNSAHLQVLILRQNNVNKLALNTAGDEWTSSVDFTVNGDLTATKLAITKDPASDFVGLGHTDFATNNPTLEWERKQNLYIKDDGDLYLNGRHRCFLKINKVTKATLTYNLMTFDSGVHVVCNGDLTVNGTFTDNSDDRLKINETPISDALGTLRKVKPRTYTRVEAEGDTTGRFDAGVVAQELHADVPELSFAVKVPAEATRTESVDNYVTESVEETDPDTGEVSTVERQVNRPYDVTKTNYWSVAYRPLAIYTMKAVQELDALVQAQAAQIAQLRAEVDALKAA